VALRFEPRGEERLKNIAEPVTVYRASLDMAPKARPSRNRARVIWAAAAALVVVIVAGVAGALYGVPGINKPEASLDQGIPKIVVLPFLEFTDGTTSLPNIGKGIAEAFNSDLSTFPDFAVVSTATSFSLADKSIPEIVDATKATFVIEGSIRVTGDKAGITMQLIGGSTDVPRRVVQFEVKTANAVALQNEIAHRLRDELGGMTGFLRKEAEKIAWSHEGGAITEYDYYIRGHTYSMKEPNDWVHTYEQWSEGLARYPDSALMRYKLMIYYLYSQSDTKTASKLFEEARALKKKSRLDEWYHLWLAARLDSDLGFHQKAVSEAKAAIAMAPYDTLSHNNLAWVLFRAGLYDEAFEWFKFAATDPNPKRWYFDNLTEGAAAARKWPEAVDFSLSQIEKNPPAVKYWYDFLGVAYYHTGQSDKAKDAWQKAGELPAPPEF
jgi:TolB-like protein